MRMRKKSTELQDTRQRNNGAVSSKKKDLFWIKLFVTATLAVLSLYIQMQLLTVEGNGFSITEIHKSSSEMKTDENRVQALIQTFQDLTPSDQQAVLLQLQSIGEHLGEKSLCARFHSGASSSTASEVENVDSTSKTSGSLSPNQEQNETDEEDPSHARGVIHSKIMDNKNSSIPIKFEQEFPYHLSCPKDKIDIAANYTLVIAYHVGMLNNWRNIVYDQLTTIQSCGVGSAVAQIFITYSNNNTDNTLQHLIDIVNLFPSLAPKVSFDFSGGMPVEGKPLNILRQYCLDAKTKNNDKEPENETVAFYFHTKGSSRHRPNWRDLTTKASYSRVLYWRKYMEYFLIERPEICMEKILLHGAQACGVYKLPRLLFYGGNFWATSCSYIRTLPELEIGSMSDKHLYFEGEGWITSNSSSYNRTRFVNLHSPPAGLYSYLIDPKIYSDYAHRWML